MAMSKKRMIEITLAQMNTTLNEMILDESMYQTLYQPASEEKGEGKCSDHRDHSFERTQLMSSFLWN